LAKSYLAPIALALLLPGTAAVAGTLGDPQVGFTAERVLVFDGKSYVGRMWNMPGEQRHEQDLPGVKPIFILHADNAVGDIVLPNLRTAVEVALPKALIALGKPGLLGRPVGEQTVNGIATTRYAVDKDIPEGHLAGSLWLSRTGIPMRCDGSFTGRNGRIDTVHWELRNVSLGNQNAALFRVPPGYSTLPPEAAATLLGMHLAKHRDH
jgi:hypothetical protein